MKITKSFAIASVVIAFFAYAAAAQDTQSQSASKTAKFEAIAKTDASIKSSLDAHDLKPAAGLVGKSGSFTGTVTKIFTPKTGSIVILNFDRDYKTALTAVVKRSDWSKFPDLAKLEGKQIVVSGKFVDFHGATEIDLTAPDQIKIVE